MLGISLRQEWHVKEDDLKMQIGTHHRVRQALGNTTFTRTCAKAKMTICQTTCIAFICAAIYMKEETESIKRQMWVNINHAGEVEGEHL